MKDESPVEFDEDHVKLLFSKVNKRKAAGPDGIKGKVLKECAEQLAGIFTYIFNMSFACTSIPSIWKTSKIIPIPKKTKVMCMNDLRPVALTSVLMKCFEKLVLFHLNSQFRPHSDPFQFAYQPKRSVDDAILTFTNNIYRHLDSPKTFCRVLFVDFSSAFNTIQPHLLVRKLLELEIDPHTVAWILNFLTDRTQFVGVDGENSNTVRTNTGAPQGCVISPVLFTIYTNDCRSSNPSNVPLLKFADDTTLQGLISNDDESAYRSEIDQFVCWCSDNFLELNVSKTKEMIFDFRRTKPDDNDAQNIFINGEKVDRVENYKYLGVTVDDKLKWSEHVNTIQQKINKRMYFLRKLSQFNIDKTICTLFYRATIESVLTFCISAWGGNCLAKDKRNLDKIIKRSKRNTHEIMSFDELYAYSCTRNIIAILKDQTHPLNCLIKISHRSNRPLSVKTRTERHRKSFLPSSVRLYNELEN